ncbi:hypothetical protein CCR83_13995 [Rhodobacter veldkampii DSM 11550]|uniref:Uncharacterized protein n=2 Tax=Phaeovulum veldkampii TaxID=33049 RepID=A0A2T4JJD0_9RHOB|nr:hypothetical protein [Phaeovulum veldkampii DSM 11550]PTE17887.1 hypothetical protein C5F46_07255 [Phaeovulum veldkampii DSM 11550]
MEMSFFRPEALAWLSRWREVAGAVATIGAGGWLLTRGGWLMEGLGAVAALAGLGWAVVALRRMRFARLGSGGPGVVEVVEGQIAYFGPGAGGFVALRELVEIRVITINGAAHWRLKQADGQALLIPVGAAGADRLFDAFTSLPGIDMAQVSSAALRGPAQGTVRALWQRPGHAALT